MADPAFQVSRWGARGPRRALSRREPPDRQDARRAGRLRHGAVGDVVGVWGLFREEPRVAPAASGARPFRCRPPGSAHNRGGPTAERRRKGELETVLAREVCSGRVPWRKRSRRSLRTGRRLIIVSWWGDRWPTSVSDPCRTRANQHRFVVLPTGSVVLGQAFLGACPASTLSPAAQDALVRAWRVVASLWVETNSRLATSAVLRGAIVDKTYRRTVACCAPAGVTAG